MRVSWLASLVFVASLGLSGTVGATTLSVAQMPSHTHTALGHLFGTDQPPSGDFFEIQRNDANTLNKNVEYAGGSQPHIHSFAATSGAANSLPPYYALAYIMRVA